jgi:hypothetical protein
MDLFARPREGRVFRLGGMLGLLYFPNNFRVWGLRGLRRKKDWRSRFGSDVFFRGDRRREELSSVSVGPAELVVGDGGSSGAGEFEVGMVERSGDGGVGEVDSGWGFGLGHSSSLGGVDGAGGAGDGGFVALVGSTGGVGAADSVIGSSGLGPVVFSSSAIASPFQIIFCIAEKYPGEKSAKLCADF